MIKVIFCFFACLVTLITHAQAQVVKGDAKIPVDAFVRAIEVGVPSISPDGNYLALRTLDRRNGKNFFNLTVFSLPKMEAAGGLSFPDREMPMWADWASNNRLVVRIGEQYSEHTRPYSINKLLNVDLQLKSKKEIFKKDYSEPDYLWGQVAEFSEARNDRIFLSRSFGPNQTALYEQDLTKKHSDGVRIAEVPIAGATFYLQHNGIARFATAINDKADIVVFRRNDGDGKMVRLDREYTGSMFFPLGFSADDRLAYIKYARNGEAPALIEENMQTGERKVLFQDSQHDFTVLWDIKHTYPFAVVYGSGEPKYIYLQPNGVDAKLHHTLQMQFEGNDVRMLTSSKDGSRRIYRLFSDREASAYYLYDKQTGLSLLLRHLPQLDPEKMADRIPFEFIARDGMHLHGFATLPVGKNHPAVVVMPHGGPIDAADTWDFDTDAQFLASRGYAVVQINFRGSAGYSQNFLDAGRREWGGKIQADLLDGVTAAVNRFALDEKRMCTYGASFGGYSALMLPILAPGRFKCAVGYVGVYDLPALLETRGALFSDWFRASLHRDLGDDKSVLKAISPRWFADRVKVPVLLIHGGMDPVAPKEHFDRMKKALEKAGNPPEVLFEDDESHGFYDQENQKRLYMQLENFLDRNLSASSVD